MLGIDQINNELQRLWRETFKKAGKVYAPMLYPMPKQGALVFVGLNPSFSSRGWRTILKRSDILDLDPQVFFQWPTPPGFDIEIAHKLEALAREHYPFFAPHKALAAVVNKEWEHLDLFAYRETKQAKMRELALAPKGKLELTGFGQKQFKLFIDLLCLAKPTAVVIINALASQIYLQQRCPRFDSNRGYYQDSLESHPFPVFPSSTLTGARALDRYSRDRLFWQVAKTLGVNWTPVAQPFVPADT